MFCTYWSLHAPFHSASLPHGFRKRSYGETYTHKFYIDMKCVLKRKFQNEEVTMIKDLRVLLDGKINFKSHIDSLHVYIFFTIVFQKQNDDWGG